MELRANTKMKRDTTVVVSSQGFYRQAHTTFKEHSKLKFSRLIYLCKWFYNMRYMYSTYIYIINFHVIFIVVRLEILTEN